jgi:anaerobic magnesium-protoporphyrin IX monomethyl ester cyclase
VIPIITENSVSAYNDFHIPTRRIKFLFLIPPNITFEDFVNPPPNISTIQKGDKLFGSLITDIPLGPISLSAYLKKFIDIEITAIDFNVELNKESNFSYQSFEEYFHSVILKKLSNYSPDYIGISALFTPAYFSILDLSKLSKLLFPESFVLVGGNFPTAMYKNILEDSINVDAVCYGEGEKALLNLLTAKDRNAYISSSSSWVNHDKLISGNFKLEHDFIWDLDEIPPLDYDILDLEGYKINPTSSRYSVKEKHSALSSSQYSDDTLEEVLVAAKNDVTYSMPIMTSRGCPFKCTFCASHAAHGRDMRYHSHERVMSDLELMIKKYGIDGVVIQDDHFMAGKYRPYEIVKSIGERGMGMFFQNALAIYALDYPFLKLLKDSGVDALVLPIESGSSRVLKELMKKPLRLEIVPRVMKDCRDAGIFTDCNIILGMPGETIDDINDAREFLKTIYADWFRIFVATPIPGSDMYKQCEAENLFDVTPLKANYKRAVVTTKHLKPEDVQRMTYLMNIELNFVFNSNMRLGNYEIALESFKNVINVKPDHAIAHFYAAICYQKLNNYQMFKYHAECAEMYRDDFWDKFIHEFNIPFGDLKLVEV